MWARPQVHSPARRRGRALAGVLAAAACAPPPPPARTVVARVDGVPLFAAALARSLGARRQPGVTAAAAAASDAALRRVLLCEWVDRQLLLAAAARHHVTVSRADTEAALARLRVGWEPAALAQALAGQQSSMAALRAALHENMLIGRYLRDHVWARVQVSDADVARCAAAAPGWLEVPEQVHARHLLVATAAEAAQVAAEIRRGVRFEDAAMAVSLTPERRRGGDLGWFARGVMPPLFDATCFAMRVGAVSPPVADTYGHHLFKVLDRRPATRRTLAQARPDIAAHLQQLRRHEAEAAALAALRRGAAIVVEEKALGEIT